MQSALESVLRHTDLIAQCDHVATQTGGSHSGSDIAHEDDRYVYSGSRLSFHSWLLHSPRSFTREFLQHMLANSLIDHSFAITMDPMISNENVSRLRVEAEETGVDLEVWLFLLG